MPGNRPPVWTLAKLEIFTLEVTSFRKDFVSYHLPANVHGSVVFFGNN